MGCLFHKWDYCKCTKCGKIRKVKDYQHKWNGCKCVYCGFVRNSDHHFEHGKCTICGKVDEKQGHSKDYRFELDGDMVKMYCSDCGQYIGAKSYAALINRYSEEIQNADNAGCYAPRAERMLDILWDLKKNRGE